MRIPVDNQFDDADSTCSSAQDLLFERLRSSDFRCGFRLSKRDRNYLERKGLATILTHGADFIGERLAPARPRRDGQQTPWQGHPVFTAQHATATCCRSCLERWHGIGKGYPLTPQQQRYILTVIERWLQEQATASSP